MRHWRRPALFAESAYDVLGTWLWCGCKRTCQFGTDVVSHFYCGWMFADDLISVYARRKSTVMVVAFISRKDSNIRSGILRCKPNLVHVYLRHKYSLWIRCTDISAFFTKDGGFLTW